MKCYYCGYEIENGQMFCPSCGKEVQLVSPQSVLEDDYLNEFLDDDIESGKKSYAEMSAKKQVSGERAKKARKKQQKKLVIVSLCVCVFVLAVVALLGFFLVVNRQANSFAYQMQKGSEAEENGEMETAASHYERAMMLDRGNIEARLALGNVYLAQKKYDNAQSIFQEAVRIDPANEEAYRGLLRVFEEQKQYAKISKLEEEIKDPDLIKKLSDYLIPSPVFSVLGGNYRDALTVELSSEDDLVIYYTEDGKDPIKEGIRYENPFEFSEDGIYRISAVSKNKKGIYSAVVNEEYNVEIAEPEMPHVSPEGGDFGAQTLVHVEVPWNCTAYYTWDGTTPDTSSEKYIEPFEIPTGTNVLSVILIDDRTGKTSEVYRGSYRFYE